MKYRIVAGVVALSMILYSVISLVPCVNATSNVTEISSAEDFILFAKQCTLDSWSHGRTVKLLCDIDLCDKKFLSVPIFDGTFNGNGYTISGVEFKNSGSYIGLFRYINGKVINLNVRGNIIPDGSKNFVGGICGENAGIIENCSFSGTVAGKNVVGGICGSNTENGRIISCSFSGNINGENFTGGVVGKNGGFLQNCINNASVNTTYEEQKNDISNIETDRGAIVENYKNKEKENEEESVLGHSDTGGIVGYSSGIVQGCINNASVGYKHIGYNVGGIAGRQSGYLLGCKNYGLIQGRKDVGGIVGQAEPYIMLNTSEKGLYNLHNELGKLNTMVNHFITDADDLSEVALKHFNRITSYSKQASESTEALLNIGTDFSNDNLNEINAQAAILSNTLKKLPPIFDSLEVGADDLGKSVDALSKAFENVNTYISDSNGKGGLSSALDSISKGERSLKKAVSRANRAVEDLDDAIKTNDASKVKNSVMELENSINNMIIAKQNIRTKLEEIENLLQDPPENFSNAIANTKNIAKNVRIIKENVDTTISSLKTIIESLSIIASNSEVDLSKIRTAAKNAKLAVELFCDAMDYITEGVRSLSAAFSSFSSDFETAFKYLSFATEDIGKSIADLKDIVSQLAAEKPLEFVKLGDDFKFASDSLFDSLCGMSDEIANLKDSVSDNRKTLASDLRNLSNQFNRVLNLLVGEIEDVKNISTDISDIFLDVSDEDIETAVQGKIAECQNFGAVNADRNTGGIAGAMAFEYAKDPEDEIEKPDRINFTYQTKVILFSCVNDGAVTGKKDCIGGVVGLSEIGTVYSCENYADSESSDGNYVGGIAGASDSAIRKSYAKCKVLGKRYVGGIAGKAKVITGSYSISNVKGVENIGAICGDSENKENLYKNFFEGDELGGVDGISYAGKAEQIDFETLRSISTIPTRFISFTVTFIANDNVVETQDIKYGDETARIKYPQIPKKDGHFGHWIKPDAKTVTENIEIVCDYKPYITILLSDEKNEKGKLALALAEGEFTDMAKLSVKESDKNPPINKTNHVKVYDISLINADIGDDEDVTIRIINENKNKVTVWIADGARWNKVQTNKKGKYVILKTKGTQNTICLKYEKNNMGNISIALILISGLVGIIVICFKKEVLIRIVKKIRTQKNKKVP